MSGTVPDRMPLPGWDDITAEVVVCEATPRWGSALQRALLRPGLRIREAKTTRELCGPEAAPSGKIRVPWILVVTIDPPILEPLSWIVTARQLGCAAVFAVLDRKHTPVESAVLQCGATAVFFEPLNIRGVVTACQHALEAIARQPGH